MRRFNNGEFDLIAVGRGQIADANFVPKLREGQIDEINTFTREHLVGDHEQGPRSNDNLGL